MYIKIIYKMLFVYMYICTYTSKMLYTDTKINCKQYVFALRSTISFGKKIKATDITKNI